MKFTQHPLLVREWTDFELTALEETALAVAQATIQNSLEDAGLSRAELARRMGTHRSFITRMMQGDHNLTIKTLARALGACGRQVALGAIEPQCVWARTQSRVLVQEAASEEFTRSGVAPSDFDLAA